MVDALRVNGKLTAEEFEEVRRIVWAPHYWLNLFNNFFWHRLGFFRLMMLILVITISVPAVIHDAARLKIALILTFALLGAGMVPFVLRSQHPSEKMLAKLNADMPDSIDIADEGVTVAAVDGVVSHIP